MTKPKRAPMEPPCLQPAVPKNRTPREQADQTAAAHEARRQQDARDIWGDLWCGD